MREYLGGCRPAETYFSGRALENEELVARSAAPASLRPERRSPCEHEQVQGGRQGEADVMIWGRRGRWGGSQDFLPGECECDEAQGKGVHAASWRGAAKVCGLCRCCAVERLSRGWQQWQSRADAWSADSRLAARQRAQGRRCSRRVGCDGPARLMRSGSRESCSRSSRWLEQSAVGMARTLQF